MSIPASWDLVPVRGRYVGTDGSPVKGRVIFTPRAGRLISPGALTTLIGRAVEAPLAPDGSFEIMLAATDDPDKLPASFTYMVREDFPGGASYEIYVRKITLSVWR